jgi:hypothetical protein
MFYLIALRRQAISCVQNLMGARISVFAQHVMAGELYAEWFLDAIKDPLKFTP